MTERQRDGRHLDALGAFKPLAEFSHRLGHGRFLFAGALAHADFGKQLLDADPFDHLAVQACRMKDAALGIDDGVDVGDRAGAQLARPRMIDVLVPDLDQQLGVGDVFGLLFQGEGDARGRDDDEDRRHQPFLAPQQGDDVGKAQAWPKGPAGVRPAGRVVRRMGPGVRRAHATRLIAELNAPNLTLKGRA